MVGKIGIKIPSHNSLTPSFLDELLKVAATSRKTIVTTRIRLRLEQRYHISIVSTGLSYLAYLGALKKVTNGYKPTRIGKKIGRLLKQDRLEESNLAWSKLLKRHKLFRIFEKFFTIYNEKSWTLEDFSSYIRRRAHATWKISGARSRVSRLCELFADKGLVEYQNNQLSPIKIDGEEANAVEIAPPIGHAPDMLLTPQTNEEKNCFSIPINSWPIKMDIKLELSDKINPEVLKSIFSFLKELRKNVEGFEK